MKIGSTSLLKLIDKEIVQEKFVSRRFCLIDTRETLSKTIFHYEYLPPLTTNDLCADGQCIPTGVTHHFYDFIGQINKRSNTMNRARYIAVHCGSVLTIVSSPI